MLSKPPKSVLWEQRVEPWYACTLPHTAVVNSPLCHESDCYEACCTYVCYIQRVAVTVSMKMCIRDRFTAAPKLEYRRYLTDFRDIFSSEVPSPPSRAHPSKAVISFRKAGYLPLSNTRLQTWWQYGLLHYGGRATFLHIHTDRQQTSTRYMSDLLVRSGHTADWASFGWSQPDRCV